MPRPTKLPSADILLSRMRAGERVIAIAREFGTSNNLVYGRLRRAGYTAADWKNKRAWTVDFEAMTDVDLAANEERLAAEKKTRERKREAEANAFYGKLPKTVGLIEKYDNDPGCFWFTKSMAREAFDMPWSDWVEFALEIIEADRVASTKP